MTQEAANSAIAAAGLVPSGSAVIPGKTLTVDTQSPGAGASVARGSTVYLTSTVHTTGAGTSTGGSGSTGASQVTVPNVVGKDVVSASAACQAVGLKLTPEVPAVSGETHVVTSQSPASGTKVAAGSTVTIAYKTTGSPAKTSTGTPATLVKVPALVGKDVVAASSLCQGVGLIMKPEPAAVAGKTHTVTGQSPAAGSSVTRGSTVNITYKTS
jgi:beta-lactam-binding protein with PASTA domain